MPKKIKAKATPPKHNAAAHALHTQGQFKPKIVKPSKGKGSYTRKGCDAQDEDDGTPLNENESCTASYAQS